MKKFLHKLLHYKITKIPHEYQWAAFLLPVFLLCVAFASMKVHPLGQTSLLTSDLFHQYAPILAEIRSKVLSGESLFYSWNMGLGTNFWPVICYNGASPLNAILLLLPQSNLSDGITVMILLRTGLSGLFFSLLFYKKNGRADITVLALSTCYALCGYVLAYFWAIMWMDAVVLLPLAVLGLWKLFCGGKPLLYVTALCLLILSNFYLGFFVCLFLLFFAPVLYMEARKESGLAISPLRAGLRFTGYSLLCAGMASIVLIPTVLALRDTSAAAVPVTWTADLSFTFFDFMSRFLLHADPVIREGLPNVFCSVVILLLISLYAMCRTIPLSRRAASLGLAFFLYLSMNSPVLDYFWHGMHYTNQIPYRQAFLMCFLLIYMAGDALMHLDGLSPKKVFYSGAAILVYLVILDQTATPKDYWMIYGSAALVIIYTAILSGFFADEKVRKWARKAFLYAVILEMFAASQFALAYIEKTEHFTYEPSYGQYADAIAKEIAARDGGQFSRAVILPEKTANDGALYHVKSISVFASTTSQSLVRFMGALGFANNQTYEFGTGGLTDVSAMLLGIRHTVNFSDGSAAGEIETAYTSPTHEGVLGASSIIEPAKQDMMYLKYTITENDNVLPIGFFAPAGVTSAEISSKLSPFEQTNELLVKTGANAAYKERTLTLISASNAEKDADTDAYMIRTAGQTATITFKPEGDFGSEDVLLYLGTRQEPTVRITRSSDASEDAVTILTPSAGQIINCGKLPSSTGGSMTVQLHFSTPKAEVFPAYCYTIDRSALEEDERILASQPLTVTSFDSSHLAGTVDFDSDGVLLTTIPYDSGWTVEVDGISVRTKPAYGAMLSTSVSKGFHNITFSYLPLGFLPGLLISLILTADFVLICVWNPIPGILQKHKKRSKNTPADEKEE